MGGPSNPRGFPVPRHLVLHPQKVETKIIFSMDPTFRINFPQKKLMGISLIPFFPAN